MNTRFTIHHWVRTVLGAVTVVAVVGVAPTGQGVAAEPSERAIGVSQTPVPAPAARVFGVPRLVPEGQIVGAETPVHVPVILNDESARIAKAVTAAAEAYVFKGDYDSGYGLFLNYMPTDGLYFPGTFHADDFGMGNGFDPATNVITTYELMIARSPLDPLTGQTPADYHFELWDGDPLCSVHTPGGGYACAKIPGTECTWSGVPGPIVATLRCDLAVPVSIPNRYVWGVLYAEGTCRTGWRISGKVPQIGEIIMEGDPPFGIDIFEAHTDYDAQFTGVNSFCCQDASLTGCIWDTAAACPGDDSMYPRGFCMDGYAESAFITYYGGPCTGGLSDFCATHVFNAFAPTDFTLTLQPVRSSGPSTIVGNEIFLEPGRQQVWFELLFENWRVPVKSWQAKIDPGGYGSGLGGTLTPYNPACTTAADCEALLGVGSKCNDPGYPPGGCAPGFQGWNGDYTLAGGINAVHLSTQFFTYGSTVLGEPAEDPGGPHTGGQLVLDVPDAAWGMFTIGFVARDSWMKDGGNQSIPLMAVVPGRITVQVDRCCYGIGTPDTGCVEGLTAEQCAQLPDSRFELQNRCSAGCPCLHDFECDDGVSCTTDSCDAPTETCIHAPDDALCDDEEPCTVDRCFAGSGCRSVSEENLPCDDGNPCTYNDKCDGLDPPGCAGRDVDSVSCIDSESCQFSTGSPWECLDSHCYCDACLVDAPQPEPSPVKKNRVLSFVPGNAGQQTALRVKLTFLPERFAEHIGEFLWVGAPQTICEGAHQVTPPCEHAPDTLTVAALQCEPYYRDWSDVEELHVYGPAVMPGAWYGAQAIREGCPVSEEQRFSTVLMLYTTRWGDLVGDCGADWCSPPDGVTDFVDITALVDKFRDLPWAVSKAQADLRGMSTGVLDLQVTFTDIAAEVDAFRGRPYWFEGPPDCP